MGVRSNPYPDDSYYPEARPFASAQGYGATGIGWRTANMKLGLVTSLGMSTTVTDEGGGVLSGTLEGLLNRPEPMYIFFLVGGYVNYTSGHPFYSYGNKFVAGQYTIPGSLGVALRYTPNTTPASFDIMMNWDGVDNIIIRYLKIYRGVPDASTGPDTTGISVSGGSERFIFDNVTVALTPGDDPITFYGAPVQNLSVQNVFSVLNMRGSSFARGLIAGGGATRVFVDWMFILASGGRNPRLLSTGVFSHFLNHSRAGAELLSDKNVTIYPHLINGRKRNTSYNNNGLIGLTGKLDLSHPAPVLWIENVEGYYYNGGQYRFANPSDPWQALTRNHQNKGHALMGSGRRSGLPAWRETDDLDKVEHDVTRKGGGMWARHPITGAIIDRRDQLQKNAQQYGFDLNVNGDEGGNSDWNTHPYQWPSMPTVSISTTAFMNTFSDWKSLRGHSGDFGTEVSAANGMKLIELFAADSMLDMARVEFDNAGNPIPPA